MQRVHSLQSHVVAAHNVLLRSKSGTQDGLVLTTDVYCRSVLGWQLVAHHASASRADAVPDAPMPGAAAGLLY